MIKIVQDYPVIPPNLYCFKTEDYKEIYVEDSWRIKNHVYLDSHLCLFTQDQKESGWKPTYRLGVVLKKFQIFLEETKKGTLSPIHYSKSASPEDLQREGWLFFRQDLREKIYNNTNMSQISMAILNEYRAFHLPDEPPTMIFFKNDDSEYRGLEILHKVDIYRLGESEFNEIFDSLPNTNDLLIKCQKLDIIPTTFNLIINKDDVASPLVLLSIQVDFFQFNIPYWIINEFKDFTRELYVRNDTYVKKKESMYLSKKNVMIIGLGTLGSKISEELARNGVKKFTIFDLDVFRPENVIRHIAPYHLIGLPKVVAVSAVLQAIAPGIEIKSFYTSPTHILFKQKFQELLKTVDLVVVAIDSPADEYEINKFCIESEKNAIYSICLDNAHFGRIFRVIPHKTACLNCISSLNNQFPREYPSIRDNPNEINPINKVEQDYNRPGVPGVNINIWEIALKTVRLCLQTLAMGSTLEKRFPQPKSDHMLICNTPGKMFEEEFHEQYEIKYITYPRLIDCSICGVNPTNTDLAKEKIPLDLLEKYVETPEEKQE